MSTSCCGLWQWFVVVFGSWLLGLWLLAVGCWSEKGNCETIRRKESQFRSDVTCFLSAGSSKGQHRGQHNTTRHSTAHNDHYNAIHLQMQSLNSISGNECFKNPHTPSAAEHVRDHTVIYAHTETVCAHNYRHNHTSNAPSGGNGCRGRW